MLAVKNSRTRWAVAESGEKRAGSWIPPPGRVSGVGVLGMVGGGGHEGPLNMNDNILYHARSTPPPAAPRQAIMPDRSLTCSK